MASLYEMLYRVSEAKEQVINLAAITIQQAEEEFNICELNRGQLYDNGMDSEGVKLFPYRNKFYADLKLSMRGKELTDLFFTGEFQRNFHIIVEGESYRITSSDEKTPELIEKYGEEIFGLTQENKSLAFEIIKPSLVEKLNEILKCEII